MVVVAISCDSDVVVEVIPFELGSEIVQVFVRSDILILLSYSRVG